MEEESLKYIYLQRPGALQRGLFLLVPEKGGSWCSKHPEPLSPSDARRSGCSSVPVSQGSCPGFGELLGGWFCFIIIILVVVLQVSLARLEEGSTAAPLIQPVPGWFGVFRVPPEGCQPRSWVLRGGPQLLVLSTAGTCEVLTHLLIA